MAYSKKIAFGALFGALVLLLAAFSFFLGMCYQYFVNVDHFKRAAALSVMTEISLMDYREYNEAIGLLKDQQYDRVINDLDEYKRSRAETITECLDDAWCKKSKYAQVEIDAPELIKTQSLTTK